MNRQRRGFTLIELLVVVSIIALLVSILMPALGRARNAAKDVLCMSGLKQLTTSYMLYVTDYDSFCEGWFGPNTIGRDDQGIRWEWALAPYYDGMKEILLCARTPAEKAFAWDEEFFGDPYRPYQYPWGPYDDREWFRSGIHDMIENPDPISYSYNGWCTNPPKAIKQINAGPETKDNYRRPEQVQQPNNTPLIFDGMWEQCHPHNGHKPPAENGANPYYFGYGFTCVVIDRHKEGSYSSFADLSVRHVAVKEWWTLKWSRSFDTGGKWTKAGGVQESDWPEWMQGYKAF